MLVKVPTFLTLCAMQNTHTHTHTQAGGFYLPMLVLGGCVLLMVPFLFFMLPADDGNREKQDESASWSHLLSSANMLLPLLAISVSASLHTLSLRAALPSDCRVLTLFPAGMPCLCAYSVWRLGVSRTCAWSSVATRAGDYSRGCGTHVCTGLFRVRARVVVCWPLRRQPSCVMSATHQIFDLCHLLQVRVGSASMWVHWGQGWALWRRGSGVPVAGCNLLLPRPNAQGRACDHGCSVHRPGCTRCCISRSHGLLHAGSVGRRQAARRLCSGTCSGCMRARLHHAS